MPFAVTIHEKGGQPRRQEFDKTEVTIGRVQGNDIILPKQNVSKRHSRIVVKDGKFIIVDLKSTNGTYVNGRKIASPMVIKETDKIYIGDFILSAEPASTGTEASAAAVEPAQKSPPPPPRRPAPPPQRPAAAPKPSSAAPAPRPRTPRPAPAPAPAAAPEARRPQEPAAAQPEFGQNDLGAHAAELPSQITASADEAPVAIYRWLRQYMRTNGIESPPTYYVESGTNKSLTEQLVQAAESACSQISGIDARAVAERGAAEALGAGSLGELLGDSSIERIYFNDTDSVWITRGGSSTRSSASFSCSHAMDIAVRRLLSCESVSPYAQGYLSDGSRLHYVSSSAGGPYVTIDRPNRSQVDLEQLTGQSILSANMAAYLSTAVRLGRVVVVSSNELDARFEFVSALLAEVDASTRVASIDSGGRLAKPNEQSVQLTASSGSGLRQALLMRPDYLVVADIACSSPSDALSAMGSTTRGGVLGVSADSPEDALSRIVKQSAARSNQSEERLTELVKNRIDIIVQLHSFGDGSHRVTQVMDVDGEIGETFSGFDGFSASGQTPRWYENAISLGHDLSTSIFG
ncbi:MAG: FHA domain-containing protein [Myxococcota bacterium]|nr:FHA domain-containing protein [Myxococcota bacterium]